MSVLISASMDDAVYKALEHHDGEANREQILKYANEVHGRGVDFLYMARHLGKMVRAKLLDKNEVPGWKIRYKRHPENTP